MFPHVCSTFTLKERQVLSHQRRIRDLFEHITIVPESVANEDIIVCKEGLSVGGVNANGASCNNKELC
jgi:hypothetical protein